MPKEGAHGSHQVVMSTDNKRSIGAKMEGFTWSLFKRLRSTQATNCKVSSLGARGKLENRSVIGRRYVGARICSTEAEPILFAC